MSAPSKCPMCGEVKCGKKSTFNAKDSAWEKHSSEAFLGPAGLIVGAMGKKKVWYACGKCGFQHEYKK